MTDRPPRGELADACLATLDTAFFRALCEPARVRIVRRLIELGQADIKDIAEGLSQDRSVVSRHLQVLEESGIAFSQKEGRRVLYALDGPRIVDTIDAIASAFKGLPPDCCPGPQRT